MRRLGELAADFPHPALYLRQAVLLAMLGRMHEARRISDGQAEASRGLLVEDRVLSQIAEIEELDGKYDRADELLRTLCEHAAGRGQTGLLATYSPMRGRVLCELGRYNEAEELAALGQDLGNADDAPQQAVWRQTAALIHAHRGEHAEAERLAREAVAIAETSDTIGRIADAHFDLGVVLGAEGRRSEAASAYRAALELYERKQIVPFARRARERLAQLNGP